MLCVLGHVATEYVANLQAQPQEIFAWQPLTLSEIIIQYRLTIRS